MIGSVHFLLAFPCTVEKEKMLKHLWMRMKIQGTLKYSYWICTVNINVIDAFFFFNSPPPPPHIVKKVYSSSARPPEKKDAGYTDRPHFYQSGTYLTKIISPL